MGCQHVAARMEAGSSTDNRVTVSMRKISDVRTLVIPLNCNRTHQMADPRDGKRVENYSTSPLHFDNRSLRIYYDKTVIYSLSKHFAFAWRISPFSKVTPLAYVSHKWWTQFIFYICKKKIVLCRCIFFSLKYILLNSSEIENFSLRGDLMNK